MLEKSDFHGRMVNDLCKYVPEHLLEPIFASICLDGRITDTALMAFLAPSRTTLRVCQALSVRNSVFKQIGLNCPNLVSCVFSP